MNELVSLSAAESPSWRTALLSILVAYVLAQVVAAVYAFTHRGHSYSRSFVLALVASGVLAAVLMLTIGGSLARGIGIVGTLALVRFRTNLHDPLDIVFVLAAFTVGVAAGTGNYAIGVFGATAFLLVVAGLRHSEFGSHRRFDGVLRVQLPKEGEAENRLASVLQTHCTSALLVTLREAMQGHQLERIYHVTIKSPSGEAALIHAVSALPGAGGVTLAMQEATVEL
jgi:uncharacterized membrane protein YhiD involved in acid resistance